MTKAQRKEAIKKLVGYWAVRTNYQGCAAEYEEQAVYLCKDVDPILSSILHEDAQE